MRAATRRDLTVACNDDLPTFEPSQNPTWFGRPRILETCGPKRPHRSRTTMTSPMDDQASRWSQVSRRARVRCPRCGLDPRVHAAGYNGYGSGPGQRREAVDPLTVEVQVDSPYTSFLGEGLANILTGFMLPEATVKRWAAVSPMLSSGGPLARTPLLCRASRTLRRGAQISPRRDRGHRAHGVHDFTHPCPCPCPCPGAGRRRNIRTAMARRHKQWT